MVSNVGDRIGKYQRRLLDADQGHLRAHLSETLHQAAARRVIACETRPSGAGAVRSDPNNTFMDVHYLCSATRVVSRSGYPVKAGISIRREGRNFAVPC
jgi:hypothetical protein